MNADFLSRRIVKPAIFLLCLAPLLWLSAIDHFAVPANVIESENRSWTPLPPERLLFGSDYCWTPPPVVAAHLAAVDAAEPPVDGATWRTLTTANARNLFPRLADTR